MKNRHNRLVFRKYPQDQLTILYHYLKDHQNKYKYMPTKREVAEHFQTAQTNVGYWFGLMEEQGMIKKIPGLARAIVLLPLKKTKEK